MRRSPRAATARKATRDRRSWMISTWRRARRPTTNPRARASPSAGGWTARAAALRGPAGSPGLTVRSRAANSSLWRRKPKWLRCGRNASLSYWQWSWGCLSCAGSLFSSPTVSRPSAGRAASRPRRFSSSSFG